VTERDLTRDEVRAVQRWMGLAGIRRPSDYRPSFLSRRILPRMLRSGFEDVGDFLKAMNRSEKSRAALLDRFFIPTTEFQRNPEVFDALVTAVAERAARFGWPRLRILSAGCSTGEEPYGLAACLAPLGRPWTIYALDRSRRALGRCRAGWFPEKVLGKVDKRLKDRYFSYRRGGWQVSEELRSRIVPFCWDLGCGFPSGCFHVILLRNVLIYLTEPAQRRLLTEAAEALAERGLLVLGKPESPGDAVGVGLSVVDRPSRIYERKEGVP